MLFRSWPAADCSGYVGVTAACNYICIDMLSRCIGGVGINYNGVSTAVTQKLLEHSSPYLTNKVYTNVDPVLRHAVEQLPVGDWL